MSSHAKQTLTLANAPDVLTVPQYCQLTQTGPDHVYRMVRTGKIPAMRIGGAIRIPKRVLTDEIQTLTA